MFASLSGGNYRRFFAGQLISIFGSFVGGFAGAWLIVELTGSGVWVGVLFMSFALPFVLFGGWGGVVADRFEKRRLLMVTRTAWLICEVGLWGLIATGAVTPWMVCVASAARGAINVVDLPARESFVGELVGPVQVEEAVALKNTIAPLCSLVGPAVAGPVIVWWGVATCYAIDALSSAVFLVALGAIDVEALHPSGSSRHGERGLRVALRHVGATPELFIPLAVLAIVGTLSLNLYVLLPLVAGKVYSGAGTYAVLSVAVGTGSLVGSVAVALVAGSNRRVELPVILASAAGVGILELVAVRASSLLWLMVTLGGASALSTVLVSGVNKHLMRVVVATMRGRVMALYGICRTGSDVIGGLLWGWLADTWSVRGPLIVGGLAAVLGSVTAAVALARARRAR